MKGFCIFAVVVSLGLVTQSERTFGATVTPLWQFTGSYDGGAPEAGLVQGSDSNFYGTTYSGGTNDWGTVFRITPTGSFTNLYFFTGFDDGGSPSAGLVQGNDGNFYGTTFSGGSNGVGVVFRVTPQGTLTTLWQFSGGVDGEEPLAGLVQGIDSNFYGTTYSGGTNSCSCGTVFKITSAGTLTTLWQFGGTNDGGEAEAGLVQGIDGNFYGTTSYYGTHTLGTVFKISPSGVLTTLWQFTGGSDGAYPAAGLVQGSDSNFYGTAAEGGSGHGSAFKITSAGTLTPLHSFSGGSGGDTPDAGLIQATNGLFYGTTAAGGTNGFGTVFSISSTGAFTSVYLFTGRPDGSDPEAGLVQGIDGNFYGTTYSGGASNAGMVFKLTLSAGGGGCNSNFVPQITAIQFAGTNVVITLPTVICQSYQLEYSNAMAPTNWTSIGSTVAGTGSPIQLTDTGGAEQTQRFYRVEIMTSGVSSQAIAQISSIQVVGSNIVITITAVAADTYQLQYSNTVSPPTSPNWIDTGTSTNGVTGTLELIDVGGALATDRFYQVMITIP
ncbi:MAG: choice-of-anchor tandem repeat GloVer-containing protein [Verrucomicrobiia bacterium]|jgi:uncharacterized repeat protein (TIGR03803 family)